MVLVEPADPRVAQERADLIDALPFLDRAGAERCYRDHMNGAEKQFE